ncbi:Phosphopantetheine adenylyltransferase [Austwickia chelonae]|uniref:Phosphopantetheine adenylyltransferase n=1 Tax=Austwickia chelonae NBRC 105200 TaxID=1184607 RepID=K6V3F5_9MICO|nr:pantetheine-phosphate adenylyltransferase [Austwickia chelonae]GAB76588.1 phosphopantetheine adenylyltransferase [Austwickia chelonae NBRC 105200]SEW27480.1 Phosphopantetheine adenylyltransferase [Austwickia chelonae]
MSVVRRCVCPGSYDPVTLGHLDVITRACGLYDEVVVAILHNPAKQGLFTPQERLEMVEKELSDAGLTTVRVVTFADRLLVDVCRDLGVQAIIKGLRGETDYSYELPMAVMNRHLTGVETLFLPGEPTYSQVSSSLMKEVARLGGDISGLVSVRVRQALQDRLASSR